MTAFKRSRRFIGFVVIVLTLFVFVWYLKTQPDALAPLRATPLYLIPILLILYGVFLITNFLITAITISISGKTYPMKDSFMLTIYSTLVNFFGPLQSGPGFRAVYLKKKIGLSIRSYTLVTVLYYLAFLVISIVMMIGLTYPLLTISGLLFSAVLAIWAFRKRNLANLFRNFSLISIVTLVQLLVIALIYYIQLRATGYTPSITSALSYAGSANLALFVAFTPGAIGIRESFILFSQSIHNIPTEYIISASLLDRAVYILFLGILFITSSGMHIEKKLKSFKLTI